MPASDAFVRTAIDFDALVVDVRQQREQEQRGCVELSPVSSHRLYNLLQTNPWCDVKEFHSRCVVLDTRHSNAYSASHLRGAQNVASVEQLKTLLGRIERESLDRLEDIKYEVVMYGEETEGAEHQELLKIVQNFPKVIRHVFSLREKFSAFTHAYRVLCLSSHDEMVKESHHDVWMPLPTEILPCRLYVAHRNTRSIVESTAIRSLNIDFVIDVSSRPMIRRDASNSDPEENSKINPVNKEDPNLHLVTMKDPNPNSGLTDRISNSKECSRYISVSPDPQLRVDLETVSQIPVTISSETLQHVVDEMELRFKIDGSRILIFSTDNPSVAVAAAIAFLMKQKHWGLNTALACMMSKSIAPSWSASQLEALRTFKPNASPPPIASSSHSSSSSHSFSSSSSSSSSSSPHSSSSHSSSSPSSCSSHV